ncbi:MAG TPA: hypothetical protein VLY63_33500, partial [Anaerolineae bacterium]|nr:hypothetical protein [Anaerolineae bacterium]
LLGSVLEPPVPSGLKQLSPALRTFVEFFGIDEGLVQVAAKTSGNRKVAQDGWLRRALSQLSGEERDAFLLRLAQGEPHLSVELHRRLREVAPLSGREGPARRTVAQLLRGAE